MAKWLTKSDYLKFLAHPAYLWLNKYDKDKLPAFDEAAQALVEQGNAVELIARQLFDDGRAVTSLFSEAVDDTNRLVKTGAQVIYQATVLTNRNLYAMADILVRGEDNAWDIYEVKSSTKAKDGYIADLAFQRLAFEEYGYKIGQTHLIYINSHYTRQGDIEPDKFLAIRDVTEAVETILPRTDRNILAALEVLKLSECPSLDPTKAGNYYDWMQIYRQLVPIAPDSVYNLCRLRPALLKQLAKRGIQTISEIPADVELGPQQIAQISVVKSGRPKVHRLKIAHQLKKLKYPLWFLDYETTFPAIPDHDGLRPYQQVPFQYSLHVLDTPGGQLHQFEFLAEGRANPMPELARQLRSDLGDEGSVIVWNKSFEMGVNDALGAHYPEHKAFLKVVNRRVFDLMEIFMKGLYADAGFFGSASIKKVLPVLVPELNYHDLSISEGQTASRRWAMAAAGKLSSAEAAKVYTDLREYCGQDTLAMVRIYEFLTRVVDELPKQRDLFADATSGVE
jgi:hypothetical protein